MAVTSAQVQELYVGLLGRAADKGGLDYWVGELNKAGTTLTLENVRANFVNEQPEYKAIFGEMSRTDTVVQIYSNLFGRAADAGGLAYWTTGAGASVNIDQLVVAFINGASTSDKQALTNKVVVSEVYSSTVGANFVKADAAAIIAGVSATPATVTAALGKLSDGSLSGVAVPAGVAQLQAKAAADKAVTDYQAAKVAELVKLNADVVTLANKVNPAQTSVVKVALDTTKSAAAQYTDLIDATSGVAKEVADARLLLPANTAAAQTAADTTNKTLNDTRDALKLAEAGYLSKVTAYEAAFATAKAAVNIPTGQDVQVKAILTAIISNANADAKAALVNALKSAEPTVFAAAAADAATVDAVYTLLSASTTTAQVRTSLDSALSGFEGYSNLKATAATAADYAAKQGALTAAATALKAAGTADTAEDNFIAAVEPAYLANKALAASKELTVLEAQLKAIVDGKAALDNAAGKALTDLGALGNLQVITAATLDADAGAVNDLFYFSAGVKGNLDAEIINAGKLGTAGKDSIYLGEGYVQGNGTIKADGKTIAGGNDSAKEVFFFQKGNNTFVVIEEKAFGSSTVADYSVVNPAVADDVAVIQLTGVGLESVSFANGVISIA